MLEYGADVRLRGGWCWNMAPMYEQAPFACWNNTPMYDSEMVGARIWLRCTARRTVRVGITPQCTTRRPSLVMPAIYWVIINEAGTLGPDCPYHMTMRASGARYIPSPSFTS